MHSAGRHRFYGICFHFSFSPVCFFFSAVYFLFYRLLSPRLVALEDSGMGLVGINGGFAEVETNERGR